MFKNIYKPIKSTNSMKGYRAKQQDKKISAISKNNSCSKWINKKGLGRLCLKNQEDARVDQECKQTYEDIFGPMKKTKRISQDYDIGNWDN